jgi:hypothetical protein
VPGPWLVHLCTNISPICDGEANQPHCYLERQFAVGSLDIQGARRTRNQTKIIFLGVFAEQNTSLYPPGNIGENCLDTPKIFQGL